jgi:3-isopropylmalate/(R)-2-methylmalate dehydratase large subunit
MQERKTAFEKIWQKHLVADLGHGRTIIHIDRHVLQETACAQAFDGMRRRDLKVRDLDLTWGVVDHSVSTAPGRTASTLERSRPRIELMEKNCREFGIRLFDVNDPEQGIVHVISPELGIALPGCTLVCADSHTASSGGVGAWAWGIGTTQVMQVLASQTLIQHKPLTLRVEFDGRLNRGVFAKDMILYLIGQNGSAGGAGFAIEYAGPAIRALPIEARLTICNMSIEFGARTGFIAADDTTYEYIAGRRFAPRGAAWDQALANWRQMGSDEGAVFDKTLTVDCADVQPQVTWGTMPQDVTGVGQAVPDPAIYADSERCANATRALAYMGLEPGRRLDGIPIDFAFIGSCTNSRLSDLQEAAHVAQLGHVAPGVRALVVPGSTKVKREAEALGLDRVFTQAGFEWRESGCSMCVAGNDDIVPPGKRCVTTSNRNFENRQGPEARSHLASPAMVAAAAITGRITDVRRFYQERS